MANDTPTTETKTSSGVPATVKNGASPSAQDDPIGAYVAQAKTWVKDHPTGALLIAGAAGLVIGRFLADALTPPPTRMQRLRSGAQNYAHQARSAAGSAGSTIKHHASATVDAAGNRVDQLIDALPSQDAITDLFESVGQAVHNGVVRGVERKLNEWTNRLPFIGS